LKGVVFLTLKKTALGIQANRGSHEKSQMMKQAIKVLDHVRKNCTEQELGAETKNNFRILSAPSADLILMLMMPMLGLMSSGWGAAADTVSAIASAIVEWKHQNMYCEYKHVRNIRGNTKR
jgi:hypothetical protein